MDTGELAIRGDLPTTGGGLGQPGFFAKTISAQFDNPDNIARYQNDFSGGGGDPLDGFTIFTKNGGTASVVSDALRINLGFSSLASAGASLDIQSVLEEYVPQLAANASLVTIAFNAWNENYQSTENGFVVRLQNAASYNLSNNFSYYLLGGYFPDDEMRAGFTSKTGSPMGALQRLHFQRDGGLAVFPQVGAFRITFDPRLGEWCYYFQQSTTVIDPLEVDQLFGTAFDSEQTDESLPYLHFSPFSKGAFSVDNLTIQVGGGKTRFAELAVFHQRPEGAGWFSYDDEQDSFGPERTHSSPALYGAVNAIGNRFVVGDGVVTRAYDSDGVELATLPVAGDVGFSPITDQLYLIDAASGKLRIYSSVNWQETVAVDIIGGVTADGSPFGQGTMKVRPDGLELAVACNDGIRLIDLSAYLPTTPPPAPLDLTVNAEVQSEIQLAWSRSIGVSGYNVYRSSTDDFATADQIGAGLSSPSFKDTDAPLNVTVFYWVTAYNERGESLPSLAESARVDILAPHTVSASTDINNRIVVIWLHDGDDTVGGFEVFRGVSDDVGAATQVADLPGDRRNYTDSRIDPGVEYYYWVRKKIGEESGAFAGPASEHMDLSPPRSLTLRTT